MDKIVIFSLCSCLTLVSGLVCWECEVVTSQEECLRRGKAVQCKPNQDQCQLIIRHGGWSDYPRIEKSCKTLKACSENYIQNIQPAWASKGEQVQCNEEYPSSVCRCCCGTELCNQNRTSCLLSDMKRSCDKLGAPRHGSMSCNNQFNLRSVCNFKCKRSYSLDGEKSLTCSNYGKWDYEQPRCRAITCSPRLKAPKFGSMKCSNGIKLRSKCRFQCEEEYRLSTPPVLQCINDEEDGVVYGLWSSPQPECIPKQCSLQRSLRHGMISCTDENYVGSVCSFTCDSSENYALYPEEPTGITRITCLSDESWDTPRPCCSLICPQFATVDLVIMLDSSSSVEASNWVMMLNFIDTFVRRFTVRNDSAHFAVVRYNAVVDRRSQITLNQYPDSIEDLTKAIMRMPYDGSGTRTGRAIQYVNDVLLPLGNREEATNVVLLLTGGASQDDVALHARILRQHALVFVIPIHAPGRDVDLFQITDIAGRHNRDRFLTDALEGGFEALNANLVDKITSRICDPPCLIPPHIHNEALLL